ncbi:MAG: hypothetical protein GXO94_05155 [Nitrospirae bacterium]|nr:hypothetical protein [Nitrospirota bacterium]
MPRVVMRLAVMDDGSVKVEKGDMGPPKKLTKREFKKTLHGKNMKNAASITFLQSNPCTWVNALGTWYYICW